MTLSSDTPILVFIGPSGTGKSTIARELVKQGLIDITPTYTDRPMRPREESLEHNFITKVEFDALVTQGFFAHVPLTFFGLPYRYATPLLPKPQPGKVPTLMARVEALQLLDKIYPKRLLYQIEAPYALAEQRLRAREHQSHDLGTRLKGYSSELAAGRKYADRIFINDNSVGTIAARVAESLHADFPLLSGRN